MLATQNLRDAVREVLSSCGLPLDYVDTVATLHVPHSCSGLSQSVGISQNDQFSQTVQSTILHRFYRFDAHDLPHIRMHRMAHDTLRLLVCSLYTVMHMHSHTYTILTATFWVSLSFATLVFLIHLFQTTAPSSHSSVIFVLIYFLVLVLVFQLFFRFSFRFSFHHFFRFSFRFSFANCFLVLVSF